jgi:hypothetical protein
MMNTSSLKGAGKLSRKLLTILVVAAMPSLGYAVDNSIYIDQTGSNATINITQDGAGNTVKALTSNRTDSAIINADGANIAITQVGSGNTVSLGVSASVTSGISTDITYSTGTNGVTGSSAIINVNAGGQQSNASKTSINVLQTGNSSKFEADVTGTGNSMSVTTAGPSDDVYSKMRGSSNTVNLSFSGTGGSNQAVLDQSGSGTNAIGINASSTGNYFGVTQVGSLNTVTVGGYTSGALTGDDNTVLVQQNGTSNMANLGISGASNSININQGGTGQDANVKISGASNTVTISQGSSGTLPNTANNMLTPLTR